MEGVRSFTIILVVAMSSILFLFVKAEKNAFSKDINQCLFDGWRTRSSPVLSSRVRCNGHKLVGLCYGLNNQRNRRIATFVVCYNKLSLIPEFSGHVVRYKCGAGGRETFRDENGVYGKLSMKVFTLVKYFKSLFQLLFRTVFQPMQLLSES